jgi:hypothetical protein
MNTIILFWYLQCFGNECHLQPFTITREAAAVVSCESGDGVNYGTYSLYARSATNDGGLWQFNDDTYMLLTGRDHAEYDTPGNQYASFRQLWNQGKGWKHWKASQACWQQWLAINSEGQAVWR